MMQAPINNLLIKFDTKYISHYSNIIKAANLNPGSQVNPADLVNIVGEVVSVPRSITRGKRGYEGFSTEDIRVGDTAIVRYDVIFDFDVNAESNEQFYRNATVYKGKEYFKCDIQKVFGVIRNGEIIMVNGYCMIQDMSKPSQIVLPQYMTSLTRACQATLAQIGSNEQGRERIEAAQGDTIFYNNNKVQTYKLQNREVGIIRQRDILGCLLQS
jgi:co-chaperonin GroES (HSP10)